MDVYAAIHQSAGHIVLWIRTPLIPGATGTDENLTAIGRYIADQMNGTVARWELCAFNNLCRDQYSRLGEEWAYAATPLMSPAELQHCEQVAKASGIRPELVRPPAPPAWNKTLEQTMGTPNLNTFSESDIQSTQPAMKVGLLATVTPAGLPHVTLLSSLMACSPTQLCFGQFTEGYSKQHILSDPKVGFLIMGLDKNLWRGTAVFSHAMKNGPEYEYYNNVPMFRYNAYFGVHTVYYLNLVAQSGKQPLPMNTIILAVRK
jgi:hypothetical protein